MISVDKSISISYLFALFKSPFSIVSRWFINVKEELVVAFNQERALVAAFSGHCESL